MAVDALPPVLPAGAPSRGRRAAGAVLGSVEGIIGMALLAVYLLMVVLGPTLAPYGATDLGVGLPDEGPSADHWLGTDQLGRDVLSRLLSGARNVLGAPLAATLVAFAIGGLLGLMLGYMGGRADAIGSRIVDVLLSLPPLLIVLVMITPFDAGSGILIIAVALVYAPRVARVLRGATQGVATAQYVQAAQARGERAVPIVLREVAPNIAPTVLVEFAVRLTYVIIFVTTLNFLGLGLAPPSPNWGLMVAESRGTVLTNPAATIAPTAAIGLLCVGIGLVADSITQRLGLDDRGEILR
jgi:peptide/nickel transport system permease protein